MADLPVCTPSSADNPVCLLCLFLWGCKGGSDSGEGGGGMSLCTSPLAGTSSMPPLATAFRVHCGEVKEGGGASLDPFSSRYIQYAHSCAALPLPLGRSGGEGFQRGNRDLEGRSFPSGGWGDGGGGCLWRGQLLEGFLCFSSLAGEFEGFQGNWEVLLGRLGPGAGGVGSVD